MDYKITRMAPDELQHWGIKGQKWGVRRYQNEDGTLTEAGKKRYAKAEELSKQEKISGKQMAKNALRRGATGAAIGSSAAQLGDRIKKNNLLRNSVSERIGFVEARKAAESGDYDFLKDFTFKDWKGAEKVIGIEENLRVRNGKSVPTWYFPEIKFKSNGAAYHLLQAMTGNLLSAPATGALIGAGAGALGSLAVDSIKNLRIDRAKKFVADFEKAYRGT